MPLRVTSLLETAVAAVERAEVLDPVASAVAPLLRKLAPTGPVKDALSGTWLGHPLHPVLVAIPLGSWIGTLWLDLTGGGAARAAATRLLGFGNLAAVPASLTGASDWVDTEGAERRVGLVHAGLNYTSLACYVGSWVARRRGEQGKGVALALLGAVTVSASGYLGGHLAYAQGVGVDTTAFEQLPQGWTDAAGDAEIVTGALTRADVAGVPVLLTRVDGHVIALADRCTHRGAPLHEGTLEDGCVVCPWHASRFALADGRVDRGPATRPQPAMETRVVEHRVQVRHVDARALRTNPVGG